MYAVGLGGLSFEWDPAKAAVNRRNHGLTLNEAKSKPNAYLKKAKRQVTIRLDEDTIDYFKDMADTAGIPYQNLINLYLRECAAKEEVEDGLDELTRQFARVGLPTMLLRNNACRASHSFPGSIATMNSD
jgi:predicted DNA binding CopG/RHH family protein